MKKILVSILLCTTIILTVAVTGHAAWHVDIEFSTPNLNSDSGVASNKLSLGTDPAATSGYDNTLDTIALLNGPLHAYLIHPEYNTDYQRLWRDFRNESLPQEWEIEVLSSVTDQPVKVAWQINSPDNLSFSLIDKDSNQTVQMGSIAEYSYSSASSTTSKRFLLQVSETQTSTTTDGSSTTPTTTTPPSSNSGGGSSSGSSKGGGCGYIKNSGKDDNINDRGQMVLNMIILLAPILLSFQYRIRHYKFAFVETLTNRRKINKF